MAQNGPNRGVFSHFLEFESLVFSDFAYYDRQQWYLAGTGGPVTEKKCSSPNWAHFEIFLIRNASIRNGSQNCLKML
jgi:hypothetical protein